MSLSELVASGQHVILIWYRGEWCPYCAATLKAYNARVDDFAKLNARVYAITPTVSSLTLNTVASPLSAPLVHVVDISQYPSSARLAYVPSSVLYLER